MSLESFVRHIELVPVITAGAYSAVGNALGGLLTFKPVALQYRNSGIVQALRIVDRSKQNVPLDLFLFDQTFTAVADNAAFAILNADLNHYIGTIPVLSDNYFNGTGNSAAVIYPVDLPYVTADLALYGQLVIRGSVVPTYAAIDDIHVRLSVRRD